MLYQRAQFLISKKFIAKQARRTGLKAKETTSETMFFQLVRTFLTRFPKTFHIAEKPPGINTSF